MAIAQSLTPLAGKRILVTGGTGSLGKRLVHRLLAGDLGAPDAVTVFSRDEAKQHEMRVAYQANLAVTDEVVYRDFQRRLQFRIGDVRDFYSLAAAMRGADFVFNAAAMKQVPACEYSPFEAVRTNIEGAENIVRVIQTLHLKTDTVVGISTDKACLPLNVMGMTKAIQERVFVQANLRAPETRFICVRYGNVLASRGSVIPLFLQQIRDGGPVTVTTEEMTRFLLSLDDAVDTVFAAIRLAAPGEIFVPHAPAARIIDVANVLTRDRNVGTLVTGIRPGEKVHELMVSQEEAFRAYPCEQWFAIAPMLPEIGVPGREGPALNREYSSAHDLLSREAIGALLTRHSLMPDQQASAHGRVLA